MKELIYSVKDTPKALLPMLETLGEHYPVKSGKTGVNLKFTEFKRSEPASRVSKDGGLFNIEYATTAGAARGLGSALADVECDDATELKKLGIMLDCSRNKVFNLDHLKEWMRQLSLLGYNLIMLYTEDTYAMPDEPMFGYMRGGYTMKELQELDAYASRLGIELVGCIQTLGHLEQALRWRSFDHVRDTDSVLNVGAPETYELIEKMIKFWSKALKSRRLHIGMDETHDLGRGKFMDQKGYVPPVKLFNEHFARVRDLAAKEKLSVEIWSDMYFRLANDRQEYYMADLKIKKSVRDMIPEGVRLWYWDYYHNDPEFLDKMLTRHEELNRPVSMASGIWTWIRMWCDSVQVRNIVKPHVEVCRQHRTEELLFTMWGDDGQYCMMDSAWSSLALAADTAFGSGDEKKTAKRTLAIARRDYRIDMLMGEGEHGFFSENGTWMGSVIAPAMWDNPLLALWQRGYAKLDPAAPETLRQTWLKLARAGKRSRRYGEQLDLQIFVLQLEYAAGKIALRRDLETAYRARDMKALKKLATRTIPALIEKLNIYTAMYRVEWFREAKAFGIDLMEARNGGVIANLREAQIRILELTRGVISEIEELENEPELDKGYCLYSHKSVATGYYSRW